MYILSFNVFFSLNFYNILSYWGVVGVGVKEINV